MSVLHVNQIRSALLKLFNGHIDLTDLPQNASVGQREDAFCSRALAAYAVSILSGDPHETVAQYITDGYGDNGLDLVYFNPDDRRLYLAQAKFSKNGEKGVSEAEALKFLAGVEDLLACRFDKFQKNTRLIKLRPLVQQALEETSTRVVLILAHTSINKLGGEVSSRIEQVLFQINDASEIAEFHDLGQAAIHGALSGAADGAPIQFDAMISDWGQVKDPYQAYYGQINAADLAQWYSKYSTKLFSKNIRKALGTTEANRQIEETAKNVPEHFWYFNNGVTVLCHAIAKKPLGGGSKTSAVLECRGVSIVNGAQTVASIAAAYALSPETVKRATVSIRFISLEHCPQDFSIAVTRATNVQNKVENRDFATLDPIQDRLRRELLLDGKVYIYKAGDAPRTQESDCTMEEAAVALACALPDVALSVLVKSTPGRVWENIDGSHSVYRRLFSDNITGVELWRRIVVLRAIDEAARALQRLGETTVNRMTLMHGNRFIAHEVFKRLEPKSVIDPAIDLSEVCAKARELVPSVAKATGDAIDEMFPGAYIHSLFKNATKCSALSKRLRKTLDGIDDGPIVDVPVVAGKVVKTLPPQTGQSGPAIEGLSPTPNETKVAQALADNAAHSHSLADLAKAAFPSLSPSQANSWVRNALRRLVRAGWAVKATTGTYRCGPKNPFAVEAKVATS